MAQVCRVVGSLVLTLDRRVGRNRTRTGDLSDFTTTTMVLRAAQGNIYRTK
jgi:hypothetical protein